MGKKHLIYVDILGFRNKAAEIAEKTGILEDVCRKNYLTDPLKEKIEEIKKNKTIFQGISEIEGSDNFIIIVDNFEEVFETIGELKRIKIPHKDFQCIPLEIGVGAKEIDETIPVPPINRTEIIDFLKEDIINPYRAYFREKHNESVKETFVLFTEEFLNALEPLDRKHCARISHSGKNFFLADLEHIHRRCDIFDFLRKIGYPGSRLYGRIDEVYVPPAEYEDIQKTLEEKRILFITGTQEYGKTYTAVRLLWEYFCRGYEVEWVKGGEEYERVEVRKWLEDVRAKVAPHRIVYFEDPFGRTRYEEREGLKKEIGTIIESVRNVEDGYVIITSREEVFKKFEKEKLADVDIKKFEESLNLKKPSYDYGKRKEILRKWAVEESCGWVENGRLKKVVFGEIRDERKLTTPLKLRAFAVATIGVVEKDRLREEIRRKSGETARAFAEEIMNMTQDKMLFLSFLFVAGYRADFMRSTYEEMVEELELVDAWDFDEILQWFRDDKVRVGVGRLVEFSHPSYSEALKYLVGGDSSSKREYRQIFESLLLRLAEKDEAAEGVAWTLAKNFDRLPEEIRNNLLLKLAEKDKAAEGVAEAVVENFDRLPEEVRNLLFRLAEKDETAESVAWAVVENFDRLPEEVRNNLLLKLAEKDKTAWGVAWTLAKNFDRLPGEIRNNLLLKLAEKDKAAWGVAWTLAKNFDRLPEEVRNLLFRLAEKDKAAEDVARIMTKNFDRLPEEVRNNLLLKLAERDEVRFFVKEIIYQRLDRFPREIRKLIRNLWKMY